MTSSPTRKQGALRISIRVAGIIVAMVGLVLVIVGIATHQPVLFVMLSSLFGAGGALVATKYRSKNRPL